LVIFIFFNKKNIFFYSYGIIKPTNQFIMGEPQDTSPVATAPAPTQVTAARIQIGDTSYDVNLTFTPAAAGGGRRRLAKKSKKRANKRSGRSRSRSRK